MRPAIRKPAIIAATAVAMLTLASGVLPAQAARPDAARAKCPPHQNAPTCVEGSVIFWENPAQQEGNQFIQEDDSGAPQFWVGVGGAASGANPFCVTARDVLHWVACLGGPWSNQHGEPVMTLYGPHGHGFTLTIADIRFLHVLEALQSAKDKS